MAKEWREDFVDILSWENTISRGFKGNHFGY